MLWSTFSSYLLIHEVHGFILSKLDGKLEVSIGWKLAMGEAPSQLSKSWASRLIV